MQYSVKKTAVAALVAFGGLGLSAHSGTEAAVIAPAKGAATSAADPMIIEVRRGGGGGRSSGGGRSISSGGSRSFSGASRSLGSSGRSFRSNGAIVRSGASLGSGRSISRSGQFRAVAPGQAFRGNSAIGRRSLRSDRAIVSHRGFRSSGIQRWRGPSHVAHRKWHRRPYYGYVIGGITLGAILAASAYYAYADEPPIDGVCWYWTDSYETEGYWDYC